MRALVTGCAGFIGSHLTESLLSDGHEVVGVDCFNDNYQRPQKRRNLETAMDWDGFDFVPLDLARGDLVDLVDDCDVVFHLAAEPGVRKSWGQRFEQYSRNNVMATQHLLDAATRWPEKRFVYASSSSVYGQAVEFPTAETAATRPLSPYGVTKLAAENLCHLYHVNYGVSTVSLRYFTVFGPRQRPDMAFHIFCRAALEGQPVTVFDDGTQTRDFSYVEDVVAATRAAGESETAELGQPYNIGGGSPATLRHALDIISELAGGVEVQYTSRERGDVRDTAAETSRARRDLGFAPKTTLEDGLRAEFEWVRELLAAHA
ncbi:MAG TPA: NAD-dependent epimerase/dehydratase family protein [Solirubrobacteraceae bacterium]|jgi:nucleoside-diphosphate-sugar epimerase